LQTAISDCSNSSNNYFSIVDLLNGDVEPSDVLVTSPRQYLLQIAKAKVPAAGNGAQ